MIKWAPRCIISCLAGFIIGVLLLPNPLCSAGQKEDILQDKGAGGGASRNEVEISVFTTKEEADRLAGKLRSGGFAAFDRGSEAKDDKTVYGVFVVLHGEPAPGMQKPSPEGPGGQPGDISEAERPVGTKRTPKDIFSRSASYFHAGLTVSEIYTDNAFNTRTDKKSDLSTVLSPEAWISVPRANEKPQGLGFIDPRAAGGLSLSRERAEGGRRYNAFLLYQSDIPVH